MSSPIVRLWRQCRGLFEIYIKDGLAYKAAGVIWIFTDVATAVTMPLVWLAAEGSGALGGLTSSDIVLYYLCILMVSNFVICHFMWDISYEIREGVFSSHIIRPVPYLQFILVRNFAWRCVRSLIFLPFFLVILWSYASAVKGVSLNFGPEFWASLLAGHLLSVTFVTALAMIALYTEEAQAIFELYYIPMLFLSGQLFPLALLPDWAGAVARFLPFYYTSGAPTEILTGRSSGQQAWATVAAQVAWVGVSILLFRVLHTRGLRRYSGVGM